MNRPTSHHFGSSEISYRYDQRANGIGKLSTISDPEGSSAFSYDSAGRVVSEVRLNGSVAKTISYQYDPATGELTGITYPNGMVVCYSRDTAGRIAGISLEFWGQYIELQTPTKSYRHKERGR